MISLFMKISKYTPLISSVRSKCSSSVVRVRFAPSPTGFLHLGGLRTALYNYLFARANNGKFILRIEDTDRSRFVPGAAEKLITDLEWAGIQIDEGPKSHGKDDPYYQSNRLELYRIEVKKLLANGFAYYCFCTENRLNRLRKEALHNGQVPKYDNKCRHLTPLQVANKLLDSPSYCIRFKLNDYNEPVNDMICGKLVYNVAEHEGDPIIVKSDGFPTYHLANVVDDYHMGITHVLRGMEWQMSTTKHLLLYKAFGWKPPEFAHLPLLLNSDGSKLSKRQHDIQISHYRDEGIFPLALLNYIIQAGGGFHKQQKTSLDLHTIDELTNMLNLLRVNASPGKLNPDLLYEFNRLELLQRVSNPEECIKLVAYVIELVEQKYSNQKTNLDLHPSHVRNVLIWALNRISSINELVEDKLSFLWILPTKNVSLNLREDVIINLISDLGVCRFNKKDVNNFLKTFCKQNNLEFPSMMQTLRAALCGLNEGPGVAEMMEVLGKDVTIQRLRNLQCK